MPRKVSFRRLDRSGRVPVDGVAGVVDIIVRILPTEHDHHQSEHDDARCVFVPHAPESFP